VQCSIILGDQSVASTEAPSRAAGTGGDVEERVAFPEPGEPQPGQR
jgi:hypothetical protein